LEKEYEKERTDHGDLRGIYDAMERLVEQKEKGHTVMSTEVEERRQEVLDVRAACEAEILEAKRANFASFNQQLDGFTEQLETYREKDIASQKEIDELYEELQLAHDQLSLCKVRMGQRDILQEDMASTVTSLKAYSKLI